MTTTQIDYDIVGSYNNQRVTNIDGERSVNLFEYLDPRGKKGKTNLPTSGISSFIIAPTGVTNTFVATSGSSPNLNLTSGNTANWQAGTTIIFSGSGTLPVAAPPATPLVFGQTYYVVTVVNSTTFTISATNGGAAINFSTTGSGSILVSVTSPLKVLFTGATNGFRGQFIFGNGNNYRMYVVIGRNVYSINTSNVATLINGSVPLMFTSGYVAIDANQAVDPQLFFTENNGSTGAGYIYDTVTGIFVQITDTAFPGNASNPGYPVDAAYLDGFFITGNGVNNTFLLSQLNNGLVWGPDFTTGTGNAFLATSGGSPNLVLSTGTTANYQVGTGVVFNVGSGGTLPVGAPPIVAGVVYYVKSVVNSTTFTISATDGGAAITFSTTGTAPIFVTNNGQLQQGAITSHPGTIVACRTLHRYLFLFSQNFTEVWTNHGLGSIFPFRRENSLLMEYGCPAIASIRVGFDKMFFLSQDKDGLGAVMMVDGTQATPVSNRALDFQLAQYAQLNEVADAWGILIKENGLIFYRLNFTAAEHTFVYNVTMSNDAGYPIWHEEQTLDGFRHPAQTHGYFNGMNYYGDYESPLLYIVDSSYQTNDGEAIERFRIPKPFVPQGYQRIRIDRMHVDLVQGVVDNIPANTAPIVYLSVSKDGGVTFGNRLQSTMGQIGQRTFRTVWRKLGTIPRGQAFVCKLEFYNEVPFVILGGAWAIEQLPE